MDSPPLTDLRVTGNTELDHVHHDRMWWRLEASRRGSDWSGILVSHAKAVATWRGLLDRSVSLVRPWAVVNRRHCFGAPQTTVDALLHQLRAEGLAALEHPSCRHRLAEVSAQQLCELMAALIRVRARCAAVTDELLIALDRIRRP